MIKYLFLLTILSSICFSETTTVQFEEKSPFSYVDSMKERLNFTVEVKDSGYDLKKEQFTLHVPSNYNPEKPFGLMVFINSGNNAKLPRGYAEVLEKSQMLWIGASNSGNERKPGHARLCMALDAVHNIKNKYNIDNNRVYISGSSGGGSMTSILFFNYPDVFTGALPSVSPGFMYGHVTIDRFISLSKAKEPWFKMSIKNSRLVLFTGTKDFNLKSLSRDYPILKKAGFNCTLLNAPGVAHSNAPAEWFGKGLAFLDKPLIEQAKGNYTKGKSLQKSKPIEAHELLSKAVAYGTGQPFHGDALEIMKSLEIKINAQADKDYQKVKTFKGASLKKGLIYFLNKWKISPHCKELREQLDSMAKVEYEKLEKKYKVIPVYMLNTFIKQWAPSSYATKALSLVDEMASKKFQEIVSSKDSERNKKSKLKSLIRSYPGTKAAKKAQDLQ